jgi:aminomethyltransferase
VKLAKEGGFVGRDALAVAAEAAARRRLVGLVVRGRGIARHGHPVWSGDRASGFVTSGTISPTLGVPIAMAYVAPADSAPGTMLDVEIREARAAAEVVPLPFYTRPR